VPNRMLFTAAKVKRQMFEVALALQPQQSVPGAVGNGFPPVVRKNCVCVHAATFSNQYS
jgi:hypothetical protein